MGFKTFISVRATDEEDAIKTTKRMFERKAKSKKWEHPKQIDQGFRAEIKVEIKSNENASSSIPSGTEFEWVKMSGLK